MSQAEVAKRAGITQAAISKYEGGILEVPEERIDALAEALGYPVGFFYQTGRRYGPNSPHLFHRKQKMPMKQLRAIEATSNVGALAMSRLLEG